MKGPKITSALLLAAGLLTAPLDLPAASNQVPVLPRTLPRTNVIPLKQPPGLKPRTTNSVATKAAPPANPATKAAAAPTKSAAAASALAKAWAGLVDKLQLWRKSSLFFPSLIGLGLGGLLVYQFVQSKAKKSEGQTASKLAGKSAKSSSAVITSCNVLEVGRQARQVWKFDVRGTGFVLSRQQTCPAGQALPGSIVAKDWRSLWQQKLNIAWLPADQVFLRVAQFPLSNFDETLSMVELQLEKLSPMPVAQIVWSVQVLPHPKGNMQTVVLVIVARNTVEEFLGQLEGQGYLADRLELPLLDQLQATPIAEDGAWIYPAAPGRDNAALVAWWYGGVLQNLDLITLPPANAPISLKEQMLQMAWAGEMEGWLTSPPRWHLVAEPAVAAEWEPVLREGLEQPIESMAPLTAQQLAGLTAKRAATADARANLLPAEFSTRYREQFYDRIWMGALLGVGALYLVGVLIYGVAVGFASYRTRLVETRVAELSTTYTNAMLLKARFEVLRDRDELKFAALDCWKAVAELLPETLTLETWNFSDGKSLTLYGTAPNDAAKQILDFDDGLRKKVTTNGAFLFDLTRGDHATYRVGPGGTLSWNMRLELNRVEVE